MGPINNAFSNTPASVGEKLKEELGTVFRYGNYYSGTKYSEFGTDLFPSSGVALHSA